ncbi:glyoxylate reductase [Ferroplasma acidiphilum]|jgi:glyoxylate reductase/gluconate 2-dehydrogenase|uniref:Glyoxylate reductase n=1 Tax=Ferroplasma acidiphilum TaxID=74969 RepID=A0A1V0N558_9ARCH|nr:D-glycerate dehydrogenase [Ferroplasma acidiphilum]ARD85278.1 glyoxylate reductase [Ferroplasma acidiphilum]
MYKVLVRHELLGNYLNTMKKDKNIELLFYNNNGSIRQWLIDNIENADGILITSNEKIDKEIINRAKKLKVISTYSVGYDHIDVEYAKSKGIVVTNTPEVLTDATADLIFGLMIAAARNIVSGNNLIHKNEWKAGWNPTFMLGSEIHGKTLGIIGMGRIGKAIAKRASGFDMKIIYYSRHRHDVNATFVDLDDLLSLSDYVVIALDLNNDTFHFVDYEKLSKMKKTAFLINGTRGKVVNENDLVKALNEKIIGGAALDVFENEPVDNKNPLLAFPNIVVTPHLGSATYETRDKMAYVAVKNLSNVINRKEPLYKV